jgi:sodium/potassium-transporting ATPase subunit alpha
VTACLFIVAERMGAHNVFVKKLDIIETLGSCSCICTDKTGTLTQNLMSVANLWMVRAGKYSNDEFRVINKEEATAKSAGTQASILISIASLNSRVTIEKKTDSDELAPNGDAAELGLYRYFSDCVGDRTSTEMEVFRADNRKVFEVPFNSSNKWQLSVHELSSQSNLMSLGAHKQVLLLKGAPDVLLGKCNRYIDLNGQLKKIDAGFTDMYTKAYEDFGNNGERVLGFAMKPLESTIEEEETRNPKFRDVLKARMVGKEADVEPIKDLIFVGLITLIDPPRPEVPQAISDCHSAGIKVVMVTGDHPLTAGAIARKIGLITTHTKETLAAARGITISELSVDDAEIKAIVIHGSEIPSLTDKDWDRLLSRKEIVFARTR